MKKFELIFKCFGFKIGIKYLYFKGLTFFLKKIFVLSGSHSMVLASIIKRYVSITDRTVQNYIYNKYRKIYDKYSLEDIEGTVPEDKVIWTCWLQGTNEAPYAVSKSLESMYKNSGNYRVIVLTLENIQNYVDLDEQIISEYSRNEISPAHLSDYIRMKVLSVYGGIWLDATQYMTKEIPENVWDYPFLVWNRVFDLTGKNAYIAIPFVENFNNSFLVGKSGASFYKFASEITRALLFDDILKIDYFGNFKAYFVGIEKIPALKTMWNEMYTINPYGLLTRQFWNKPISEDLKKYIHDEDSFFFMLTYKKKWIQNVENKLTVQEYIIEEL